MTLSLQTYNCDACGMRFEVACFSELQEKLKKHKCSKVNKKVERTAKLQQNRIDEFMHDVVIDRIHQHNFDELLHTGMIVDG